MQIISATEAKKNKHFPDWEAFSKARAEADKNDAVEQRELNDWFKTLKLIQCDDAQVAQLRETALGTVRQIRNADERRKAYIAASAVYGPKQSLFMLLESEETE